MNVYRLAKSPVLLAGAYLWVVAIFPALTTATLALARGVASGRVVIGGISAFLALGCVVAGAALRETQVELSRSLGVWGLYGTSLLALLFVPDVVDIAKLDPTRGALGALGFLLYAMAWGIRERREAPEDDPRANLLTRYEPREKPSLVPIVVTSLGVAVAGTLVWLAFRVHEVPRGALAQASAGLSAVAMVTAASEIATAKPSAERPRASRRLRQVGTTLLVLVAFVLAGVFAVALGR